MKELLETLNALNAQEAANTAQQQFGAIAEAFQQQGEQIQQQSQQLEALRLQVEQLTATNAALAGPGFGVQICFLVLIVLLLAGLLILAVYVARLQTRLAAIERDKATLLPANVV